LRAGAGLRLLLALGTLSLLHCEREAPPAAAPPAQAHPPHPLEPWRWHTVGGLLVVQGELEQPTELTLKGRFISESCRAPLGPVRWELYRPPPGEVAELRTGDGKLLAKWDFDATPAAGPVAPVVVKPEQPKVVQPPPSVAESEPQKAVPPPPPPAPLRVIPPGPWAKTEPHLPLPKPVRAARPPVPPPPPVAKEPPKAVPPPAPLRVIPPGPWAKTEPHLPLPRPIQTTRPTVPPPPPVAKAEPQKVVPPPPAPAPVRVIPPGPWAKTEPHLPLPRPIRAPRPPVPPTPPVAKVEPPKVVPPPPVAKVEPPKVVPPPPVAKAEPPRSQLASRIPAGAAEKAVPPPPPATGAQDWPGAGEGLNLVRGPKGERRVCMTFDGGSTAEVAVEILDVLRDHKIRTTIFLTGDFIRKYPDLVRRMAAEGHELGNHTLTHPHFAPRYKRDPKWTRERIQKELLDADRALYKLLGRPMDPYWRPPFGEQTAEIRKWAEELGYRTVSWSEGADTLDWTTVKEYNLYRNGSATIERLERRMQKADGDGLIVLMHLGSMRPALDRPANYLGPFMDRAIKEGWHFVCIGDYLKSMGRPRWDASRRVARIQQGD